jgi:hypothetical protein
LIGAAAGAFGYLGQWHSFTNQEHVSCMQTFGGRVYVGTTGGIRAIDPATLAEKRYGNLDGLLEADVVAMTVTPSNRLWAASRGGFLYEWDGAKWRAFGRGYVAERWRPTVRAIASGGKNIAIGTDKGLTFFDTDLKVARLNLTKFAGESNVSVLSLLRKGDTLFIGTEKGAFKAAVDWDNLLSRKYLSIFDPRSWLPVPFPPQKVPEPPEGDSGEVVSADTLPRKYEHLLFNGDTLESYARGKVQHGSVEVEALSGKPLKVAGITYPSLSVFDVFEQAGDKLFLGGPTVLAVILDLRAITPDRPMLQLLTTPEIPHDTLANIASFGGNTLALSPQGLYRLEGGAWKSVPGYALYSNEIAVRSMRNLAVDRDGTAYIGTWGFGVFQIKGNELKRWDINNTPCLDTAFFNYTVVGASSRPADGLVWATSFKGEGVGSYSLFYVDLDKGEAGCPGVGGSGTVTHRVKIFSDSKVSTGSVVAVAGEAGLDLYQTGKEGAVQAKAWKSVNLGSSSETWDAEMDGSGRIWSLMSGKLVYIDSLQTRTKDELEPKSLDDFNGKDCRQMEADAAGSFWIGCANGLYRLAPAPVAENSTSDRYTLDDGLLSNTISDISVDKQSGKVWVATDLGVSMLESDSRPPASDADGIKVYPNPFLAKHRLVVFDNLPSGAEVKIHTASGSVIKAFPPSAIKGGQCQWDGNNAAGRKITPGVYLYSIVGGGKTKRGKLIVDR